MTSPTTMESLRLRAGEMSSLMKTLSHPNRLLVVCELMEGERSVSEIEQNTGVRQPGLSRELARLREQGLVTTTRESKAVFYRLSDPRLKALITALCETVSGERPLTPVARAADPAGAAPKVEGVEFATVGRRPAGRVRINPDPYRKQ